MLKWQPPCNVDGFQMGDMGKGRGQPMSERVTSRHYCCCFPLLRSIKRYDGYEGEVA